MWSQQLITGCVLLICVPPEIKLSPWWDVEVLIQEAASERSLAGEEWSSGRQAVCNVTGAAHFPGHSDNYSAAVWLSRSLFFCLTRSFTLFYSPPPPPPPHTHTLFLSLSVASSPSSSAEQIQEHSLRLAGTEAPRGHKPQQVFMPTHWWGWWLMNPHSHVSWHLNIQHNKIYIYII